MPLGFLLVANVKEKQFRKITCKTSSLLFNRRVESLLKHKHILKHTVVKHSNARMRDCFLPLIIVPPNNKPIDNKESSMPVYAVPKKSKVRTPAISIGDVYAHVCKSNRSTSQISVRKHES